MGPALRHSGLRIIWFNGHLWTHTEKDDASIRTTEKAIAPADVFRLAQNF